MHILLQKLVPQHLLSRIVGKFADLQNNTALKNSIIKKYIQHYGVKMEEAVEPDYTKYPSFNEFFIRQLKPELRPIDQAENSIVSPVDGTISEIGKIKDQQILQAKDVYYTVSQLLGEDDALAKQFENGSFMTAYLAPGDYHRIHMPASGELLQMTHVPGGLFSVNPYTVSHVAKLFAINERVICLFETEFGKMAVVAIGAIIVGGIAMNWHGVVTPPTGKVIQQWHYDDKQLIYEKGAEMGHFRLGSTVVVLFQKDQMHWDTQLSANVKIKMGQLIGYRNNGGENNIS